MAGGVKRKKTQNHSHVNPLIPPSSVWRRRRGSSRFFASNRSWRLERLRGCRCDGLASAGRVVAGGAGATSAAGAGADAGAGAADTAGAAGATGAAGAAGAADTAVFLMGGVVDGDRVFTLAGGPMKSFETIPVF